MLRCIRRASRGLPVSSVHQRLYRQAMMRRSAMTTTVALVCGLAIGWLDVGASEVQGPLLLLMLATFAIALVSRTPAWLVALAVALGLPLAHMIAYAVNGSANAQWGMLVALAPALIASYSGRGVALLVGATSSTLAPSENAVADDAVWHQRPASAAWLLGAALLGCALVGAVPVYATSVARGQPFAWWLTVVWQIVSFLAWAIAVPLVLRTERPVMRTGRGVAPAEIAMRSAIVAGIALLHSAVLPLLTRALFIPLGPGGIPRAALWALAAYLPLDALAYGLVAMLGHASDATYIARAAAEREAVVRGELAASQLATLRTQLRPHFLFNALNAAAILTRRGDSVSAARVLHRLAELLRYVLKDGDENASGDTTPMVRLGEELDFADSYLVIERERFPDRLRVATEVTPDAREALVPHLILQPLVENAVHLGIDARVSAGVVTIRAWRIGTLLHLAVENDGPDVTAVPGDGSGQPTHGSGLAKTRAMLHTIYGDEATLTLVLRREGGALAHITLPYRA